MAFDEAYNEPENVEVLVKSLDPGQPAQLHYAHAGDAGADLRTTEEVTLKPFQRALVPTGVAIALPAGYVALVHPRSGLAVKQGVTVLNAPGTIDAGYRGEIKVPLINLDPERAVTFHPGDRIAQLVIQRYVEAKFIEALDRPHLLSDVTRVLSDHGVNIISGSISTGTDRVATSQFSFEMADPQHLNTLLAAVRKIEGVFDVYRITGAKDSAEPRLRKM